MRVIKNIPASIRAQLLNYAKQQGRPFNEILQYYALQRFLYRLSKSEHSKSFILKGAFLLKAWGYADNRPTMDIDLLGKTENSEQNIVSKIRDIIETKIEPDGLVFDEASILCEPILKEADYTGIRVNFLCSLDTAKISIQIDIGFGDIITPDAVVISFPVLLKELDGPAIFAYSIETVVAEKFHAMITLGNTNSRMKDLFDVYVLLKNNKIEYKNLQKAIAVTFKKRNTVFEKNPVLFDESYYNNENRTIMWKAFLRKMKLSADLQFPLVVKSILEQLQPIYNRLSD